MSEPSLISVGLEELELFPNSVFFNEKIKFLGQFGGKQGKGCTLPFSMSTQVVIYV